MWDYWHALCFTQHLNFALVGTDMNQEKLAKLQAEVRIGGKGSARRKKKVVHRTAGEKKIHTFLKKSGVSEITGIEEVNMFNDDGTVIHFNYPRVQASAASKVFAITGHAELQQMIEILPGIFAQLRPTAPTRECRPEDEGAALDSTVPKTEDIE
ncbi:transcription factor BTF3 homolog 4-like isoform X1 [Salarias fasciatus]|uniref:transcription factor BTF3 homolog 4-like isoform X1 n=2 Tax=Salarias fasciatus TaxID=181472 RepID=UPI001176DC0F|nr:transcription factor BTF3 homolog 4-like isoform X1 [Salarias fasciatus]